MVTFLHYAVTLPVILLIYAKVKRFMFKFKKKYCMDDYCNNKENFSCMLSFSIQKSRQLGSCLELICIN